MSTGKETGTSDRGRSSRGAVLGASRRGVGDESGFSGGVRDFSSAAGGGF